MGTKLRVNTQFISHYSNTKLCIMSLKRRLICSSANKIMFDSSSCYICKSSVWCPWSRALLEKFPEFMEPWGLLPHSQKLFTFLVQSQINPVHAPIPLLGDPFQYYPPTPSSSKWSLAVRFPHQIRVSTSPSPFRSSRPAHLILLALIYNEAACCTLDFASDIVTGKKYRHTDPVAVITGVPLCFMCCTQRTVFKH